MADTWYLCLTPDWRRRTELQFTANPEQGSPYYRFWYNSSTGKFYDPDGPAKGNGDLPHIKATDNVGIAIEILFDDTSVARFRVQIIAGLSAVDRQPNGKDAQAAGQSTAFQPSSTPQSSLFTNAPAALNLPDMDDPGISRSYMALGAVNLFQSGTGQREAYEISVNAAVVDAGGNSFLFSCDPEMDVDS